MAQLKLPGGGRAALEIAFVSIVAPPAIGLPERSNVTWCVGGFAVGTALVGGPPAQIPASLLAHWAPALGAGVEAHVGKGLRNAGWG